MSSRGERTVEVLHEMLAAIALVATMSSAAARAEVPAEGPWALAIHGGVSSHVAELAPLERGRHLRAMASALFHGRRMLREGRSALDTVEAVVTLLEDDPLFNAGKGAVCNYEGEHDLDASIMDGRRHDSGAVGGVKHVANPIALARQVLEGSRHVFLVGEGAEAFARSRGIAMVDNATFATPSRKEAWKRTRDRQARRSDEGSTVGCVALDRDGHLAAATSTGGLTCKRWGRVGDSPCVGAGTWADDRSCAVSCTGIGEDFIRNAAAHSVSALMRFGKKSLRSALRRVLGRELPDDSGGMVSVDRRGNALAMSNTETMLHAVANSRGLCRWGLHADRVRRPKKKVRP